MKTPAKRRHSSKKLPAIQTSRHLHVAPTKHTGHLVAKRHTSYALLVMIVLCVGVLLSSWTKAVTAADFASDSYVVTAGVRAPLLTKAATIDSPANGAIISGKPITVTGSCPQSSYVILQRNSFMSGVALCSPSGTYSIVTDLFDGTNRLVAQAYNFNDIAGPVTAATIVRYTPLGLIHRTGYTEYTPDIATNPAVVQPLLLTSEYKYHGTYIGDNATWQLNLRGGSAPYAVYVEWGDGSHQILSISGAGDLTLQHAYQKTGGYHGSYNPQVSVIDAAHNQTYLQLLAIISSRHPTATVAGSSGLFGGNPFDFSHYVSYAWSTYGVVLLMLFSFWLGERRELQYLRVRKRLERHVSV